MTCAELQELLAAHALGALEPEERAAVEAHLAQPPPHSGCAEALTRAHRAAASLARGLAPIRPDERIWQGIEKQLGLGEAVKPAPSSTAWIPWVAIAALLVAVIWLASGRVQSQLDLDRSQAVQARLEAELDGVAAERTRAKAAAELAKADCDKNVQLARGDHLLQREAAAMLERPGTRLVPLGPAGPKHLAAVAIVNLAEHRAFVMGTTLPAFTERDYELWVIHGKNAPEAAGLMHALGNGVMLGEVDAKLLTLPPDALAVSIEVQGGAPDRKPTDVELVGKMGS